MYLDVHRTRRRERDIPKSMAKKEKGRGTDIGIDVHRTREVQNVYTGWCPMYQ